MLRAILVGIVLASTSFSCGYALAANKPPKPSDKVACEDGFARPPPAEKVGGRTLIECRINYLKAQQACLYIPDDKKVCVLLIDIVGEPNWQKFTFDCQTGEELPPGKDI